MKFMRWWLLILAVILMSAAAGCEKKESADSVNPVNANNKDTPDMSVKNASSIGEKIEFNGSTLTVMKVERSNGNDTEKPKPGNVFIIVTVHLENTGKNPLRYAYYYFGLINSQGQKFEQHPTTLIDIDTTLPSGELAPGKSITGTVVFERPAGETKQQLQYIPYEAANQAVINLE